MSEIVERAAHLQYFRLFQGFLLHFEQLQLEIFNRVHRIGHRLHPVLIDFLADDLVDHGVTELVFALKVMEQGALGYPGFLHDLVDAHPLKSVHMDFFHGDLEDFSSGFFGCFDVWRHNF